MGGNLVSKVFLALALLWCLLPEGVTAEPAQMAIPKPLVLNQIEQAVSSAVQKSCDRIEVQATNVELAVILVNCSGESLRGRDAEANRIADIVTDTISEKENFRTVTTLRIDYVACDKNDKYLRQIDEMDFFRDLQGKFRLRTS